MASSSSLPSLCSPKLNFLSHNNRVVRHPQVRSQLFGNEGKSAENIVDANLSVLRERIAEVKKKESMDYCCRLKNNGWYYQSSAAGYDSYKQKRENNLLTESLGLMGFVGGALGLVFLSGSLCISLVSLLVQLINT